MCSKTPAIGRHNSLFRPSPDPNDVDDVHVLGPCLAAAAECSGHALHRHSSEAGGRGAGVRVVPGILARIAALRAHVTVGGGGGVLVVKAVLVAGVGDVVLVVLELVLLERQHVRVGPAPEKPLLPVEVGCLLPGPDGGLEDGGAVTPGKTTLSGAGIN